ncbi:unnamed protein product [Bursaphelenchus xylophilus]|uniref:(pine wood nematode) hypothetical protein n=1 Tax=Bursaphelenchus xylophilus TaxID=6326 RepID=A0A1I7SSK4_BURXY|nr:unnamed protein product [Bursaphelenchus xylophilus]CAG9097459.1 unnamed protein product [Bursaphelenchus xylophilus]
MPEAIQKLRFLPLRCLGRPEMVKVVSRKRKMPIRLYFPWGQHFLGTQSRMNRAKGQSQPIPSIWEIDFGDILLDFISHSALPQPLIGLPDD